MKVSPKVSTDDIEKLLNSYLDGELPPRQLAEVQRLLAKNKRLANRLDQLRKARTLLQAVPYIEAPASILESVKAAIEKRTRLYEKAPVVSGPRGARHLMLRKAFTAAAMFILIAVLGAVIYTIVAPETVSPKQMANQPIVNSRAGTSVETGLSLAQADFTGRLELSTAMLNEASASINRALRDAQLDDQSFTVERSKTNEIVYTIVCPSDRLGAMLQRLESDWPKFDSAKLVVQAETPADRIVISQVTIKQISEIVAQSDGETCIRAARYFAIAGDASKIQPGETNPDMPQIENLDSMTIPKPVLTGGPPESGAKTMIGLTVVVTGGQ